MGSFIGHVIPGVIFAAAGTWWTFWMCRMYHLSVRRKKQFTSRASFRLPILPGRFKHWPAEGYIKIVGAIVAITAEVSQVFVGKPIYLASRQHATMYVFGLFSGIVDVLIFHRWSLPPNMDYVSLCLAFSMEFIVFKFHLHGRSLLDSQVHTLLLYTIGACAVATIIDMKERTDILSALSRAYFLLLQGTWLTHIGFMLYPPSGCYEWDGESHEDMMMSVVLFAWHAFIVLLLMLAINAFVAFLHRRAADSITDAMVKPDTKERQYDYTKLNVDVESDTDSEHDV